MEFILIGFLSLFPFLLVPWTILLVIIIFFASIGKSLGVRKLYIHTLLHIFEYGRKKIEVKRQERRASLISNLEDEGYGDELPATDEKRKMFNRQESFNDNQLIRREKELILVPKFSPPDPEKLQRRQSSAYEGKINFDMKTWLKTFDYTKSAMEAIIEDQVTSRFEAEELKNWNFLTRTNQGFEFISMKLTLFWILGFFVRYCVLLPLRFYIFCCGALFLILTSTAVGVLPNCTFKTWLNHRCYVISFRILSRALSAVITFHNKELVPQGGSICVANHTSPIDCIMLSNDQCYSLIGQSHGGLLGVIQRALNRASSHIWFERSEAKDRSFVLQRLKDHTSNIKNPPMLIFPEGTCINNTSVMQFKKGSFEVGCPIYPVAIKYDPRFGDAFWNSNRYSMARYLYMMMSSWAIVCDVWYLPPVQQNKEESAIDFANRVKNLIARQGGLVDLAWDGQLKRIKPKKEWKEKEQEKFSHLLTGDCDCDI